MYVPKECTLKAKDYNEESILRCFKDSTIERNQEFYKRCFKPEDESSSPSFLVNETMFNEETKCVVTMLCQFLGLVIDKYILETLMSLLFILSSCPVESDEPNQSLQVSCIKFDEFLVENIHSQLMKFHKAKTFMFESYLLKMFLSFNKDNLQLLEMVLTDETYRDYIKFMNFLMIDIYAAIFQKSQPRVLPEMWDLLQDSTEKRT